MFNIIIYSNNYRKTCKMLNKLQHLINKYNIGKALQVIILLTVIYLAYRIFTTPPLTQSTQHEGFESFIPTNVIYGNEIPTTYSSVNNTCSFIFSSVVRLDTIRIYIKNDLNITPTTAVALQYTDPSGNNQSIVNDANSLNTQITVGFDGVDKYIKIVPVLNTQGQAVYTNQVTLTIGDPSFVAGLDSYIKYYDFYGRNRQDLTYDQFQAQLSGTSKNIAPTNLTVAANINELTFDNDYLVYSMKLSIDNTAFTDTTQYAPDGPYSITVQYRNSIYPSQTLQVGDSLIVRNDSRSFNVESPHIVYLFFGNPIIANSVIISAQPVSLSSVTNTPVPSTPTITLSLKPTAGLHTAYGHKPTPNDITNFQRNAQTTTSENTGGSGMDVCPSMNDMIQKQVQAQQLCDAIELQDKIKAEKIRLDKNNQYLIKLKAQQDQIDQLNSAINQLQTTRASRDKSADMARVARYNNQKMAATTVRDLANQRLQSQDANNLYLDVKIM